MHSEEDDQYLMYAVDSCSADVVSANPYWSMSDTQRAEWKKYAKCRLAQEQEQEQEQYDAQSDDIDDGDQQIQEAEELEKDEQKQQTEDSEPATITENQPNVVKEDKKKLWVTCQQWARSALREETGKQKIPLKTVNARARIAWIEDGWGAEK